MSEEYVRRLNVTSFWLLKSSTAKCNMSMLCMHIRCITRNWKKAVIRDAIDTNCEIIILQIGRQRRATVTDDQNGRYGGGGLFDHRRDETRGRCGQVWSSPVDRQHLRRETRRHSRRAVYISNGGPSTVLPRAVPRDRMTSSRGFDVRHHQQQRCYLSAAGVGPGTQLQATIKYLPLRTRRHRRPRSNSNVCFIITILIAASAAADAAV